MKFFGLIKLIKNLFFEFILIWYLFIAWQYKI